MIRAGRVTVDGAPATIGQQVDPETVHIEVDGIPLPVRPGLVYYLLYKPEGVVTTVSDPQGRPTVIDLVPADVRVHPVGRLDLDSQGLLVLTNDGDLTHRLTHPRFGVPKTYLATVTGRPAAADLRRLVSGVELDDGPATALSANAKGSHGDATHVEVVIAEGRNREVRRMFDAIGHPVVHLVRTAVGPVRDRDLAPGTWRPLRVDEVRSLYAAADE